MKTEQGKYETKRGQSKRRNCQQKCFHSFKCALDQANVCFFFYVNSLLCLLWCLLCYLLYLCSSHKFTEYKPKYKSTTKGVVHNVNLSNFGKCFTKKSKNRYCQGVHFRASGVTSFENFSTWCHSWWCLHVFEFFCKRPTTGPCYTKLYFVA